jgi:hypothetical protein
MRADTIYMYPYGSTTTLHFGFNGNSAWRLINQNTSSFQVYNSTPTNAVLVNISSSGNVGIGNSFTNPSARLHVSGSSNSVLFEIDSPAQNNIIYVSGSGNVGIGTSTPNSQLHISGASAIMTLSPINPLPTSNVPSASFATSGSGANLKPYFWNGSSWTALF